MWFIGFPEPVAFIIDDHLSLGNFRVDVRSAADQELLSLLSAHTARRNEPAKNDCRTPAAPGFAVNVNFAALVELVFDEFYRVFDICQLWMCKVDGWNAELADAEFPVGGLWTGGFFASVDDRRNTGLCQFWHIDGERQGAQQKVRLNFVPPMPELENAPEHHVPDERWDKK